MPLSAVQWLCCSRWVVFAAGLLHAQDTLLFSMHLLLHTGRSSWQLNCRRRVAPDTVSWRSEVRQCLEWCGTATGGEPGHLLSFLMHAGACSLWEARWQSAFEQPFPGSHYPGNLPLLTSTSPDIDRLYYWAALAMVSLERTNYPSRPRTFVISQGPSNSLDGSAGSE